MRIKIIMMFSIMVGGCSFKHHVEGIDFSYQNSDILVTIKVDSLIKNKNAYFYYGDLKLELSNINIRKSDIPYLVVVYNGKKSPIYNDAIGDRGEFWQNLDWSKKNQTIKIYFVLDSNNISPQDISIKEIDKKFRYLPSSF